MTLVMTLLKSVLLVVVVAVYWRPLDIAKAIGVPPPEGGFVEMQGHVARFLLTFMSYTWALSCSSPWHYTLMALIALQTICWASFMSKDRVLSSVLENFVDAQSEKEAFELTAVVLFGLVLAIVLFGGRAVGKYYYRRRLRAFYTKHNPDKIGEISKILQKYKGKEELLFTRLSRKYSVLSHTPTEDAVDEVNQDGDDEAFIPERQVIEEVEYIQEPTKTTTMPAETIAEGENSEEDDEGFQVIKSTVKSPVNKPPSGPASPATKSPVAKAPAPPRSPSNSNDISTNPAASAAVRTAIEDARRAQEERVQQRIAELSARGKKKQ